MIYNILLIIATVLNVVAQLLLKAAAQHFQFTQIKLLLLNSYFWIALLAYGFSFILYFIVLSKLDLSKAYPISSVAILVSITILSVIFFHESLTPLKSIGITFSIIGIILLFR